MSSRLCLPEHARSSRPRVRTAPAGGTIYTAGRPPWFTASGEVRHNTFVIGIAGGSASGKSSVANRIIDSMGQRWVCQLSQDSFYRPLNPEELVKAHANDYDFDHPDAIDLALLTETLRKLKRGEQVDVPVYDFGTHSRLDGEVVPMYGASVVIFEGLFALASPELRDLIDLKVFVDEDADVRLARRLRRDIAERGREMAGVIKQYNRFVKPSFEAHILPTLKFADLVIPRGATNEVAMSLLIKEVQKQLHRRGLDIRRHLRTMPAPAALPESVKLVPRSKQLQCYQTTVCNEESSCEDFVFASEAIMVMVFEFLLSTMPFEPTTVQMISEDVLSGRRPAKSIVGVSVLRAGLTMEASLGRCVQAVALGQILIQTNQSTGEPELHHASLPELKDKAVILMDPTVATGAAALMAVRVLLDHGCRQEDIYLATLFSTLRGLHAVAYAFPSINIVTASTDHELNPETSYLEPGLGNFGDRFFGTPQEPRTASRTTDGTLRVDSH